MKICRRGHQYSLEDRLSPNRRGCPVCRKKSEAARKLRRTLRNQAWKGEKWRARIKARYAIACGEIPRLPCAVCGTTESLEAHHEDYSKPLEIVWLCTAHHHELHESRRATP